jgi:gamma-glutamyltranspeptidase/glutathione hydrolase
VQNTAGLRPVSRPPGRPRSLAKKSPRLRLRVATVALLAAAAWACASTKPATLPPGPGDTVATHGMVVAAHPDAARAGLEILRSGGNAVDAAVAVAFALTVAEPNASGVGGGGFALIAMAGGSRPVVVDYRESAPRAAAPERYSGAGEGLAALTEEGPLAVGVPGLVAGAAKALELHGTKTLAEVLRPAIRLAREGVVVSPRLAGIIADKFEKLSRYPAAARVYLPEGLPPEAGTKLLNEDLARTFEAIAAGGPGVFYEGEVGRALVGEVKSRGGLLDEADLAGYRAIVREPVRGSYRGAEVLSACPPTAGGTALVELLNVLESFDLAGWGRGDVRTLHVLAEASKMVFVDKAATNGDPDFVKVPLDALTSKEHARRLAGRIRLDAARFGYEYETGALAASDSPSTSHVSVVDADGNAVALTQSVNLYFGSGLVAPGTGFVLNNHLADFDTEPGHPNSIGPGRRPSSSIAPTILLKDGRPYLVLGTPGATRIVTALAQIVVNTVDFGLGVDEAIEAPRIHAIGKTLEVEGGVADDAVSALSALGHHVERYPPHDDHFGGAHVIRVEKGRLVGGADSRRDGAAAGY